MTDTDRFYRVIERPVISEKATDASAARNAYTFRVPRDANKVEIRGAVEKLFEVKVRQVNTLRVKGKWKRVGRGYGRTKDWKKAIVVLDEGQTIDVL